MLSSLIECKIGVVFYYLSFVSLCVPLEPSPYSFNFFLLCVHLLCRFCIFYLAARLPLKIFKKKKKKNSGKFSVLVFFLCLFKCIGVVWIRILHANAIVFVKLEKSQSKRKFNLKEKRKTKIKKKGRERENNWEKLKKSWCFFVCNSSVCVSIRVRCRYCRCPIVLFSLLLLLLLFMLKIIENK